MKYKCVLIRNPDHRRMTLSMKFIFQALTASCLTSKVELNYYIYKLLEPKYKQSGSNFRFRYIWLCILSPTRSCLPLC